VHLVGFIIRIYDDSRSSECQILNTKCSFAEVEIPVTRYLKFITVNSYLEVGS
jgi:hypothetical protein